MPMQPCTDGGSRQQFASLAHQKAGQVVALRDAAADIHDGMTPADMRTSLISRAKKLEDELDRMGAKAVDRA